MARQVVEKQEKSGIRELCLRVCIVAAIQHNIADALIGTSISPYVAFDSGAAQHYYGSNYFLLSRDDAKSWTVWINRFTEGNATKAMLLLIDICDGQGGQICLNAGCVLGLCCKWMSRDTGL